MGVDELSLSVPRLSKAFFNDLSDFPRPPSIYDGSLGPKSYRFDQMSTFRLVSGIVEEHIVKPVLAGIPDVLPQGTFCFLYTKTRENSFILLQSLHVNTLSLLMYASKP